MTHKDCSMDKTDKKIGWEGVSWFFFSTLLSGCQVFFSEKQWSSGCSYILSCIEEEGSGLGTVQVEKTDMILHVKYVRTNMQSLSCTIFAFFRLLKKVLLFWIHVNLILSRSQKNAKMTDFFRNNFSEDRWRKAALKNAFSLLGKQRFQHSAAFFLLAGSLKDAVEASGK